MPTYVIGDIHGCYDSLLALLDRFAFDPGADTLWLVGDLVNRGPRSLDVLRWAMALGDRVVAVLGNHDLHLLAMAEGIRSPRITDTAQSVLSAPDAPELLRWLRERPLAHRHGEWLMVHAGLPPQWTRSHALEFARDVEQTLRGSDWRELVVSSYAAPTRLRWSADLDRMSRRVAALAALTRLRVCALDGEMALDFARGRAEVPQGCLPWFQVPGRGSLGTKVIFGHWAALGLHLGEQVVGLDSGCMWGGALTAYRLEDGAIFQQPSLEARASFPA